MSRWVRRGVRAALDAARVRARTETSVAIIGDAAMRTLNRTYRTKDHPTDVLSFAERDPAALRRRGEPRFLGDIVIALPTARRQARRAGHALRDEITMLAVHGTLHLLGHDDETDAGNHRMLAVQDRVLAGLRPAPRQEQRDLVVP